MLTYHRISILWKIEDKKKVESILKTISHLFARYGEDGFDKNIVHMSDCVGQYDGNIQNHNHSEFMDIMLSYGLIPTDEQKITIVADFRSKRRIYRVRLEYDETITDAFIHDFQDELKAKVNKLESCIMKRDCDDSI